MRVLVCGSQDFWDGDFIYAKLDCLRPLFDSDAPMVLLSGNAKGVDTMAEFWAEERGVPVEVFAADWAAFSKKAGLLHNERMFRNERMLREGRPDVVVAFPGQWGTRHMIRIAREAGVPVVEIEWE